MKNILGSLKVSFVIATELQYNLDLPTSETSIKIAKRERERGGDKRKKHNICLHMIQLTTVM